MHAVTGVTGKVGGTVAETLLAAGKMVRAVVRDGAKGRPWADKGCEVAVASIDDADALAAAFAGADGVFLMTPPNYDPEPGFPDTWANAVAIANAIAAARPGRVVFLSTVGAQVAEPNLLNNSKITEETLRKIARAGSVPARRMVHGKCVLGCGGCAKRSNAKLSAAAWPRYSHGGDGGYRSHSRSAPSGGLERRSGR
jgi:nucleoside-diphosphate-sugar epimerase